MMIRDDTTRPTRSVPTDRRSVLAGIATGVAGLAAGCSDRTGDGQQTESPSPSTPTSSPAEGPPEALTDLEQNIETVYRRLESLPLARDGEFVFDVRRSLEDFDNMAARTLAKQTIESADGLEQTDDVTDRRRAELLQVARLGLFSVDQRTFLQNTVVVAVEFERQLGRDGFVGDTDSLRKARRYLQDLNTNVEVFGDILSEAPGADAGIRGYDPRRLESTRDVLKRVLLWAHPAYAGLHLVGEGLELISEGNKALDQDRHGDASQQFERSRSRLVAAEDKFDTALGRGERIERVGELVDKFRCILPPLQELYEEVPAALTEMAAGNEEEAREIAREPLREASRGFNQCR
jgi:hypothetical protein